VFSSTEITKFSNSLSTYYVYTRFVLARELKRSLFSGCVCGCVRPW